MHFNRKKSIFKFLCFTLFLSASAFADIEFSFEEPLSISKAVEISLENNPKTAQAWWRAKKAAASYGISRSELYPNISANVLYAQGRDYEFINGPNKTYREASASFILNYLLFDFGRTNLAVASSCQALIAACWENEYLIQQVISDTLLASYSYLEALDQKKSLELSVAEAELMVETVEDKFIAGLVSDNDLFAAKARLAEQMALLARENARLKIARGTLARALSIDFSDCLSMMPLKDPDKNELESDILGLNELIELAEHHRKDFQSQWAKLNEKALIEKKTMKNALPTINFRADSGLQTYFDKSKSHKGDYNIALNLNVPIFTGFKLSYERKLALADTQLEWEKTIALHLDAALEILTFSEELQAAKSAYQFNTEALYYSEKSYSSMLDKYKVGAVSIYDLVDSQSMLTRARFRKNEAKSKFYRSIAELAFSLGLSPTLNYKDLLP